LWIAGALAVAALVVSRSIKAQNIYLDLTGQRMNMSIPGMDALKKHEGFSATVYLDAAGLPTIGYGHKLKRGESFPDGVDEATAIGLLAGDIQDAEDAVNAGVIVPWGAPLSQARFDALVSFAYNVGAGAFAGSTLLKKLNAGDLDGAAAEFARWNKIHVAGELVANAGLSARRDAEARLFSTGEYA